MRKKILTVAVVVLLVALLCVGVACKKGGGSSTSSDTGSTKKSVNLVTVYTNAGCVYPWAEKASDGSYISIDTNPYDYDSDTYSATRYMSDAIAAIRSIHTQLGLPDSLLSQMNSTTALQGRQSKTFSSIGVEVEWTYHPDKGLEVMYSKIID